MLQTYEVGPRSGATASVVWMHGLGASNRDFGDIVHMLGLPDVRFVFPQAPDAPVTINGGFVMPSWYDIRSMERGAGRESAADVYRSAVAITQVLGAEVARGIPSERVVLAGFSQGGAMALHVGMRHPHRLAGIMVLSAYLLVADRLGAERDPANAATPLLSCHGRRDEMVPHAWGRAAFDAVSEGRPARWHDFDMGHEMNGPEVLAIRSWLRACLG